MVSNTFQGQAGLGKNVGGCAITDVVRFSNYFHTGAMCQKPAKENYIRVKYVENWSKLQTRSHSHLLVATECFVVELYNVLATQVHRQNGVSKM